MTPIGQPVVIMRVHLVSVIVLAITRPTAGLEVHLVLLASIRMTLLELVVVKFVSVVPRDRDDATPTVGKVNELVPVVVSTLVHPLGAVTGTHRVFYGGCDTNDW